MSFTIFQSEKTPFQAIKTRKSKSRKIDIFPKGLTHGFGKKNCYFSNFFFTQYRPRKPLLRYSRAKKPPFQPIKTRSLKSRKIEIFPNGLTQGCGSKIAIFLPFFLGNNGTKMAIIGPKPWVNPFRKMSIFRLFKVFAFIA